MTPVLWTGVATAAALVTLLAFLLSRWVRANGEDPPRRDWDDTTEDLF